MGMFVGENDGDDDFTTHSLSKHDDRSMFMGSEAFEDQIVSDRSMFFGSEFYEDENYDPDQSMFFHKDK